MSAKPKPLRKAGVSNGRLFPAWVGRKLRVRGAPCAICGAIHQDMELDHIVSLKRGGASVLENAQLICRVCNAIKRDHRTNEEVKAYIEANPEHYARRLYNRKLRRPHLFK